jgi:hypothetical protein
MNWLKIITFLAMTTSPGAIPATLIPVRNQIVALETFSDKLAISLACVDKDPGSAGFVGVKPLLTFRFAANATIFAAFLGRKPNTVRLAFREHNVSAVGHLPWELSNGLPDYRNWRIFVSASPLIGSNPRETFRFQRSRQLNRRLNHRAREETRGRTEERTREADNEQRLGIDDGLRDRSDLFDEFDEFGGFGEFAGFDDLQLFDD